MFESDRNISNIIHEEMQSYFTLIVDALNLVGKAYFNLATTYEPNGIVRERVFCYELYHKMRCLQEIRGITRLSLNGEIDKRGHIEFSIEDRRNPDFVFHIPGHGDDNTFVIEVKGKINATDCMKDFETISTFIKRYRYKLGVFILYNHSLNEFKNALFQSFNDSFPAPEQRITSRIFIICKEGYETDAEVIRLDDLLI